MRSMHDLELLKEQLKELGFCIMLLEDHSDLLRSLMAQIVFSYGSMNALE